MKKSELAKLVSGMDVYNKKAEAVEEYIGTEKKDGKVKVEIGGEEGTKLISFRYFKNAFTLDIPETEEVQEMEEVELEEFEELKEWDEPRDVEMEKEVTTMQEVAKQVTKKVKSQNVKEKKEVKGYTESEELFEALVVALKAEGFSFRHYVTTQYIGLRNSKRVFAEVILLKKGLKVVISNEPLDSEQEKKVVFFDKARANNSRFYIRTNEQIQEQMGLIKSAFEYSLR